ncbi:hypothetical protein [Burkholderia sp. BCC1970]|uniref:hypothetical protein n=1 Tax=Burkholderia sp. BCC1970 TaxID=2817437 RepID=UPI002ABE4081|nr:hypothetical protein [Burkholderia sp. BCC1970]
MSNKEIARHLGIGEHAVPESQGGDYIDLTSDFTKGGDVPTGLYLQVGGSGEAWALIQIEYNDPPVQVPTNCITPPSPQ